MANWGVYKMKQWAVTLLLLIFPTAHEKQRKAALQDLASSVIIHVKVPNKYNSYDYITCSGTYISPTTVLTAAHCFDGVKEKIWIRDPYQFLGAPVHLIAWDKKADLALLDAPYHHTYVKLGTLPDWGDRVVNIGCPFDFEFVESEGKVSMTEFHPGHFTSEYLVTTAMANPGSSGGGAFNDRGELIGVNTMVIGIFGWTGITMSVNTVSINLFLGQALRLYHRYGF